MFVLYNRLKSDILEEKISKVETLEELESIVWADDLTVDEQQEIVGTIEQMIIGI